MKKSIVEQFSLLNNKLKQLLEADDQKKSDKNQPSASNNVDYDNNVMSHTTDNSDKIQKNQPSVSNDPANNVANYVIMAKNGRFKVLPPIALNNPKVLRAALEHINGLSHYSLAGTNTLIQFLNLLKHNSIKIDKSNIYKNLSDIVIEIIFDDPDIDSMALEQILLHIPKEYLESYYDDFLSLYNRDRISTGTMEEIRDVFGNFIQIDNDDDYLHDLINKLKEQDDSVIDIIDAIDSRDKNFWAKNSDALNNVLNLNDDQWNLSSIPDNAITSQICIRAIQKNGFDLQYVPEKFKTYKLCLAAVQEDETALEFVPKNLRDQVAKAAGLE